MSFRGWSKEQLYSAVLGANNESNRKAGKGWVEEPQEESRVSVDFGNLGVPCWGIWYYATLFTTINIFMLAFIILFGRKKRKRNMESSWLMSLWFFGIVLITKLNSRWIMWHFYKKKWILKWEIKILVKSFLLCSYLSYSVTMLKRGNSISNSNFFYTHCLPLVQPMTSVG